MASPLPQQPPPPTPHAELTDGPVAGGLHSAPLPATKRPRIDSVDLLRGLVMVVMLLDHTRAFTHWSTGAFDPTDLTRTWPALFFTRWITHYCAPLFVLLAGAGAYLQLGRGKSKADLSAFLWKRGLWLVLLEIVVVRVLVTFEADFISFLGFLQVIWVLGVSMIVLAALIHLPVRAIAIFGAAMILLHNLLDGISVPAWQGPGSPVGIIDRLWMVLHQGGAFPVAGEGSPVVFVLYPLIPWIGVMAVGYALGHVYDWPPQRRRHFLVRLGIGLTIGFIGLRAANVYGDPSLWGVQRDGIRTLMSFLNTTKYPPSLLFLLMTAGPGLIALAWLERLRPGRLTSPLVVFGRVPLFFYLLQWLTAHLMGIVLHAATGRPYSQFLGGDFFGPWPEGAGFSLPVTYAAWIAGVLILYPICRWYAGVKRRRRDWWLSYL
jgi:uncharacterized membrane protein